MSIFLSDLWLVTSSLCAPAEKQARLGGGGAYGPLSPFTILCTLYSPMSRLHSATFTVSIPSKALSPLHGPLSSLLPSVASTALVILWSSVPFKALCPLRHCVPSMALCPLYGPLTPSYSLLSPLWPSLPSTALCPLYGPLSPLQPSVPSTLPLLPTLSVLSIPFT